MLCSWASGSTRQPAAALTLHLRDDVLRHCPARQLCPLTDARLGAGHSPGRGAHPLSQVGAAAGRKGAGRERRRRHAGGAAAASFQPRRCGGGATRGRQLQSDSSGQSAAAMGRRRHAANADPAYRAVGEVSSKGPAATAPLDAGSAGQAACQHPHQQCPHLSAPTSWMQSASSMPDRRIVAAVSGTSAVTASSRDSAAIALRRNACRRERRVGAGAQRR